MSMLFFLLVGGALDGLSTKMCFNKLWKGQKLLTFDANRSRHGTRAIDGNCWVDELRDYKSSYGQNLTTLRDRSVSMDLCYD